MVQADNQESQRRIRSTRAARSISAAVLLSRILGLVRDRFLARLFGAGAYMDAYNVAFRIPNLFRDLVAEGALSSAFVPTFTEILRKQGKAEAWRLANLVVSTLLFVLGLLAVVFFALSDYWVYLLAAGFASDPGKLEVTSHLVRILSPFLIFVSVASILMGMLNALNRYFVPALAPALFNLALIFFCIFVVPWFEYEGILAIYAVALGALVGGGLQCAVQFPLLYRRGYRFRLGLDFRHAALRRIGRLVAPALLGVSALQINVLINTQLASWLGGDGPISWLNFAFRIMYLPIGLCGVAVGVVNLREVSISAAREEWDGLKAMVAHSVKTVSLIALPAGVGLLILAGPIVRLLFETGEFTAEATQRTAAALICYSFGLFAYSCIKVYAPTFYALGDTRTPVRSSLIAVATNLAVNLLLIWLLPPAHKYLGLALGTAASVWVNLALLVRAFGRRVGSSASHRVASTVAKNLGASILMGILVGFLGSYFQLDMARSTWLGDAAALFGCIGAGALFYFVCCRLLGVEEVGHLFARLRK